MLKRDRTGCGQVCVAMPPSSEALFLISLRGMLRRLEILEVQARIRTAEGNNNSLEICAVQLASARVALAGALRSFNRHLKP